MDRTRKLFSHEQISLQQGDHPYMPMEVTRWLVGSASIGRTTYLPTGLDHLPAATAHTNTRL